MIIVAKSIDDIVYDFVCLTDRHSVLSCVPEFQYRSKFLEARVCSVWESYCIHCSLS